VATLVHLAKILLPAELSRAISTRGQATFAAEYQDTHLLLVRAEAGSEVLSGLEASAPMPNRPGLPARRLEFQTEALDKHSAAALLAAAKRSPLDRALLVRTALERGVHFVLPLRKRENVDQISLERISVGRAMNKDVVLRDPSVSKFHAWFELHDERELSISDAGSTNHTLINGKALTPRLARHVMEGDEIAFGSVSSIVCTAETLWSAIHVESA
jgi:hypothetical protein